MPANPIILSPLNKKIGEAKVNALAKKHRPLWWWVRETGVAWGGGKGTSGSLGDKCRRKCAVVELQLSLRSTPNATRPLTSSNVVSTGNSATQRPRIQADKQTQHSRVKRSASPVPAAASRSGQEKIRAQSTPHQIRLGLTTQRTVSLASA
jgi:hypothetical protein